MASMARNLVWTVEGGIPSVKSFKAEYKSESSFECRVRRLGRDLGLAGFVVAMSCRLQRRAAEDLLVTRGRSPTDFKPVAIEMRETSSRATSHVIREIPQLQLKMKM
jgi:hypothetical protein